MTLDTIRWTGTTTMVLLNAGVAPALPGPAGTVFADEDISA
ncbi:hypothetical protein ACFT7S_27465 [Streptomyces sp. NPDC057136]